MLSPKLYVSIVSRKLSSDTVVVKQRWVSTNLHLKLKHEIFIALLFSYMLAQYSEKVLDSLLRMPRMHY